MSAASVSAHLPCDATATASARRLVSEFLCDRLDHPPDELVADAALVVHELVLNGVVHGAPDEHGEIEVLAAVDDDALLISVVDGGMGGQVVAQPFTSDLTHGRGLSMVAALSSSWRVDRSSGTRVSAWLPLMGPPARG